jgi:hypothetical protein
MKPPSEADKQRRTRDRAAMAKFGRDAAAHSKQLRTEADAARERVRKLAKRKAR